jgi:hypothetical protein
MRPDRTELDPRAFGLAAGTVTAALCALCALYVAVTPGTMPAAFGSPMHAGMAGGTHLMMWGGFVAGLLLMSVVVGLAFAATAALYNRFLHGFQAVGRTDVPMQRRA